MTIIIISEEIIKPSSSTPSHLKTYNLSINDQNCESAFIPMVLFYANSNIYGSSHQVTFALKNALSQTLTKYYPFAGRLGHFAPAVVDCNDDGVEFLEASINSTLSNFLLQSTQHENLDQLFPYDQVWSMSSRKDLQSDKVTPLAIQVNHFECGGVAVATSLSHKIGDAYSLALFLSDWAKMTRIYSSDDQKYDFPDDPYFISFPYMNMNIQGFTIERSNNCVTKSFIFSNIKINNLKLKVKAMTEESGQPITNLTRYEVLSWLLCKCAIAAATKNNSGCFKPTVISHPTNIRGKMIEPLPEKSVGNLCMLMSVLTKNENETKPESLISELKRQKMKFQGLKNIETALGILGSAISSETSGEQQQGATNYGAYICSSICGHPKYYDIDFGWGNPIKATIGGKVGKNSFMLMDTPTGDGFEVLVCLAKEDMSIFQSDPELLAFC